MQCHRSSTMVEKHHEGDGCNPNSSDMFSGYFPKGFRMLVFDKDQNYLMTLENHLKVFHYEVTCCNDEERAMHLLRNHTNRFDIALIEVQKSDGDKLRLLSEIRSEMDIPIIIMSKDDSLESVINWISHGACDYLLKPLRLEDLRFIFKHVVKMIRGKKSVVVGEVEEKAGGDRSSSVDSTIKNPNNRKRRIFPDEQVNEEDQDHDRDHTSTSKKRRVVWDDELHKKFTDAVEYIGHHKAVPKKILEIMNVENISRENVASHLQKYRLNIIKSKENNKIKKEEMNQTLLNQLYDGRNVQFPTHHINNIPQPSVQQHNMNPNNLTAHLMSPLGHHHDGVSIAVSDMNLVMTHQTHQVSDFNAEESLVYNNFNEDGSSNLASLFTQNLEEVSLFHFQNPAMAPTAIPNDHHLPAFLEVNIQETKPSPVLYLPSFPSTSYTHSAFLNQQENEGFNYNTARK